MSSMAVLAYGSLLNPKPPIPNSSIRRPTTKNAIGLRHRLFLKNNRPASGLHVSGPSSFRTRSFQNEESEALGASKPENAGENLENRVLENQDNGENGAGSSFLLKLAIAVAIAATFTVISIGSNGPSVGSTYGLQFLAQDSSSSAMAAAPVGFSFKAFGYRIVLPEHPPGWIYFWLLMAAGFGLFISEEALNIWVGISLARKLTLDGTWHSFAESFSKNAPYITSTILWVYWGVCISDLIPFYLGKLFRQSGGSDDVCSKLGIGKEKALRITNIVQRYGNLTGLIERLSIGVRNPTGFLAGAMGISPECFFAGVCCGGLITLPLQSRAINLVPTHSLCFPNSVRNRVLAEGAPGICHCNSCNSRGNLDVVSICSGCIDSIVPFLEKPILLVGLRTPDAAESWLQRTL